MVDFMNEMTARKADWQLTSYGGVGHAFAKPDSEKLGIPGVAYNKSADQRSWQAMLTFLREVLPFQV